jgi:hypothetical protein
MIIVFEIRLLLSQINFICAILQNLLRKILVYFVILYNIFTSIGLLIKIESKDKIMRQNIIS